MEAVSTTYPWHIRPATHNDIKSIMWLIQQAQQLFAANNIDQWQDNYPNTHIIQEDIDNGHSHVIEDDKGQLLATAMISFDGEPTYKHINGEWLSDKEATYAVVHRIAVHPNYKRQGVARFILSWVYKRLEQEKAQSFRIDTHRQNTAMQNLLKSMNFQYCGIIYLEDGAERLAYEKCKPH